MYTAASTKSHASGKIKNRSFRILRMKSDVFFYADSESPHMTKGKNATLRSYRRKLFFRGHVISARQIDARTSFAR